jgi:acetone carboxylase gamma subunit
MDKETLERLLDGEIAWERLQNEILPSPKDDNRFENVLEIYQERVPWDEQILVPLNDHLFVVAKDGTRLIKAECGHEICETDDNWKLECQIRVREDGEELHEMYPELMASDPEWTFQIREFFCPNCYTQVDTKAVPAGYPIQVPFEPDIDTFYEEWLNEPIPDRQTG